MRSRGLIAALAALALSGCGGEPAVPRPGAESGQFAGSGDGVGALVDFRAVDTRSQKVSAALAGQGLSVGVASIVNRTDGLVAIPTFTARLLDGRTRVLGRADRDGRVRAEGLEEAGTYIPANGAITVYLVLPGSFEDVSRMGMRVGTDPEIELSPQPKVREAARSASRG